MTTSHRKTPTPDAAHNLLGLAVLAPLGTPSVPVGVQEADVAQLWLVVAPHPMRLLLLWRAKRDILRHAKAQAGVMLLPLPCPSRWQRVSHDERANAMIKDYDTLYDIPIMRSYAHGQDLRPHILLLLPRHSSSDAVNKPTAANIAMIPRPSIIC